MADSNNPGQFGNRKDTVKQAQAGGNASTGSFGDKNGADPHAAGRRGAAAEPHEAKVEGGKNSHKNDDK
jgi:hypothetical protein